MKTAPVAEQILLDPSQSAANVGQTSKYWSYGRISSILLTVLLPLELGLIIICSLLNLYGGYNYFSEGSFFTAFSSIQIGIIGLFCFINGFLGHISESKKIDSMLWVLTGVFFVYLAVDEWFMIHELVGMWVGILSREAGYPVTGNFRDIPFFMLYAATAFIMWRGLKVEFQSAPGSRTYLAVGGAALFAAVAIDVVTSKAFNAVFEDGFKLIGFLLVLISLLNIAAHRLDKLTPVNLLRLSKAKSEI